MYVFYFFEYEALFYCVLIPVVFIHTFRYFFLQFAIYFGLLMMVLIIMSIVIMIIIIIILLLLLSSKMI